MRLLQRSLVLFFVFCFLFFSKADALAEGEFAVDFDVTYQISQDGKTQVTQDVTLTNLFSTIYATSYSLTLSGSEPGEVKVQELGQSLPFTLTSEAEKTTIEITFPNALVGKGKTRRFIISYETGDVALRNGSVWEITIPKLTEAGQFRNYNLSLFIPTSFGQPAYISPEPISREKTQSSLVLKFLGIQLERAGVVAAFGQFQVFDFSLAYHLKNPNKGSAQTEIALPPDTAYQRVYYQDLAPKPLGIRLDEDGNWLALYKLRGQEQLDVTVRGAVQIFASPQDFYPRTEPENLNQYLQSSQFWQTNDPQIQRLGKSLATAENIYNFVVASLSYDYSRVREGVERLGAKSALENPQSAICMEFTDLFIALARSAGIPAREVNGYAYTDNPRIQPLSLVADVLHAWPEYWHPKLGVWVPVDPTWGKTTGGVDYFSKLDLNHFTFVIHGRSPTEPAPAGSYKLATSPQKDVIVSFGRLPQQRTPAINVQFEGFVSLIPLLGSRGKVWLENNGSVAVYNLSGKLESEGLVLKPWEIEIPFLPPNSREQIPVDFQVKTWGNFGQAATLSVLVAGARFSYNIPAETLLIGQALAILTFLALLTLAVVLALVARKLGRKVYEKIISKTSKFPWRLPF